jgi:hypothetical protein
MLTLLLTADTLRMGGIEAGGSPASPEKWGVGHPRAGRHYSPPHPHFYPSRKNFSYPPPISHLRKRPQTQNAPYTPLWGSNDTL